MTTELDIIEKIKKALHTSCEEAFYFSDDETNLIDAEYLLTVNVAKEVKELNHYFGTPYKIFLEHNTKKFSTACTPQFGRKPCQNFLGYKDTIRSKNNTKRSGKIDVAIYTSSNGLNIPLCAIEVKGFNPSATAINKDLERNAEYFQFTSPSGDSTLPFTIFTALHSYKNVWNDEKEAKNLRKLEERYNRIIAKNYNLKNLKPELKVMTVRRGIPPDTNNPDLQETGLNGDEDYQFVGVIVTMKR